MTIQALFFYLFATVTIASAVMVISSRNPVHSVLFLILCFVNAAGLFVLMGAEYLAMLLIVVYVGAVAVLFLFVVMMLDVDFVKLREGVLQYLPVGLLIGVIFLAELIMVFGTWVIKPGVLKSAPMVLLKTTNAAEIGKVLYTEHVYYFQMSGLILLVAMIGAIVLTLRHKKGVKRQDIPTQNARTKAMSMEIKSVKSGEGLK
jgi:NADH-quinone oxidoreductase subunit J